MKLKDTAGTLLILQKKPLASKIVVKESEMPLQRKPFAKALRKVLQSTARRFIPGSPIF
jgi:hypothetical protein